MQLVGNFITLIELITSKDTTNIRKTLSQLETEADVNRTERRTVRHEKGGTIRICTGQEGKFGFHRLIDIIPPSFISKQALYIT